MPTVDESGVWEFEAPVATPAAKAATWLAELEARKERRRDDYRFLARDVANTARIAREAIGTPTAHILFEKVKALQAASKVAFAAWRRAERSYERESRATRLYEGDRQALDRGLR